jgi:hypothetical protein
LRSALRPLPFIAPLMKESLDYLNSFSIYLKLNFMAPDLVEQVLAG